MSHFKKFFLPVLLFTFLCFLFSTNAEAADFANPVLRTQTRGCEINNLRTERFSAEVNPDERQKLCRTIDKITVKLNSTRWSPALSGELKGIWEVFSFEPVVLRPMPKGASSRMLAMAEAFPSGVAGQSFEATVYVRPEKSDSDSFFQVLLHELRHVYDFYDTWKNQTRMNSIELERRAFLLMGKISQETPEKENFSGLPSFWKDSWANLPQSEIIARREAAVEKYLDDNKLYRNLEKSNQSLDFSFLKSGVAAAKQKEVQFTGASYKKDGERLPERPALPKTNGLIPQNIREVSFDLDKPKNTRDEKEILRVALSNEKKIYYGMSNFVYDQKLQLECWKKGKSLGTFAENNTIARTEKGNALFQSKASPLATNTLPPCISRYEELKTDFTETFWASPGLEKMPIRFAGFVEVEGKTLARYSVLQPDTQLYNQLANEYSAIRPFRVFVGTIYVSPEDGQIVKFWGTSFPEDTITSNNSRKIVGSYSVTALRQRLNINGGVWVTVHIGTVAVANVGENSRPFSYTVNFENYRQSTTGMRVLDDDETVSGLSGGSK